MRGAFFVAKMFNGIVNSIKKDVDQATNVDFLDVEIGIYKASDEQEEAELVETRKLSFPLNTTDEEMKVELQKYMDTYNSDFKLAQDSKEHDAAHAQADKVIESMTGVVI